MGLLTASPSNADPYIMSIQIMAVFFVPMFMFSLVNINPLAPVKK
jgi:hypothetical protein